MTCNHAKFTKGCETCEATRTTKEQEIEAIDTIIRRIHAEQGIVGVSRWVYEFGVRA